MSDFIFSSQPKADGELSRSLQAIYSKQAPACEEFHGSWGSLAVTASRYYGFQPLETDRYVCVVIGGPVLYFQDNDFIGREDRQAGTRAILEHWLAGGADWSEDLSGPFVLLVVDKQNASVECITDLMMFIPVYQYAGPKSLYWGTHVDALANACGRQDSFDEVSLADFVLNHAVTHPYTVYQGIFQCMPGTIHRWSCSCDLVVPETYWQPLEDNAFATLEQAARVLREGVQGYIDRVSAPLEKVAHFISAGEDSRSLAGMLPVRLERDAFVFLDSMNREGRIASRVAAAYGANFTPGLRSETHYLDILPEASALVGTGHQYIHAHSLGFDKKCHLADYRAVFGGYISDTLLKGQYARKPAWLKKFPFLPQVEVQGESRTSALRHPLFPKDILDEMTRRRREHYHKVHALRPHCAHEWFELWPATMRLTIPNIYCNRRLFASHEVFMAKESVKVAASAPIGWKLNRRLFHAAFKPALRRSRYIAHADGRLPYFPWWVNSPIQFVTWFNRQLARRIGRKKSHQGPWSDWEGLMASSAWEAEVDRIKACQLPGGLDLAVAANALHKESTSLSLGSKLNLLQLGHQLTCGKEASAEMTVMDASDYLQQAAQSSNRSVLG